MTFTDDDLKRLKEKAERSNTYTNMDCDKVLALLARLEAAEALIPWVICRCASGGSCHCGIWDKKEIWKKTCGD